MNENIKARMMAICDEKIAAKGSHVSLSFYAFFSNKNNDPKTLMEVAQWWIMEMKLDHFEKAEKIKSLLSAL